jgi:hypothetical protein
MSITFFGKELSVTYLLPCIKVHSPKKAVEVWQVMVMKWTTNGETCD